MARKYIMRSKEEKLAIVRAVLSGAVQCYENEGMADQRAVMNWVKKYLAEGEACLEQKKKSGNPLSGHERRNTKTNGQAFCQLSELSIISTTSVEHVKLKENRQFCLEQNWRHKEFCVYERLTTSMLSTWDFVISGDLR